MPDVAWPNTLPAAQQYGFSEKPAGTLAFWTANEGVKPLRRKRFTGLAVVTSYSFVMTQAQMAAFRTFWAGPLASGANDITMYDPAVAANVRLTPTDTYEAQSVTFGVWQVTIPVRRELA
jgi:hypothetical protein